MERRRLIERLEGEGKAAVAARDAIAKADQSSHPGIRQRVDDLLAVLKGGGTIDGKALFRDHCDTIVLLFKNGWVTYSKIFARNENEKSKFGDDVVNEMYKLDDKPVPSAKKPILNIDVNPHTNRLDPLELCMLRGWLRDEDVRRWAKERGVTLPSPDVVTEDYDIGALKTEWQTKVLEPMP
jgi:hypothetical protein